MKLAWAIMTTKILEGGEDISLNLPYLGIHTYFGFFYKSRHTSGKLGQLGRTRMLSERITVRV